MAKPRIVLAMMDGLVNHAFTPAQLARLEAVGELIDPKPLSSFDEDRAARVLADADVLIGHWGCPTLTAEVVELAPELRLFAYAAGTVKWQVTDAVWARAVTVTSAAAANAVPVAEYTVAMVLLANKGVLLFREWLRDPTLSLPLNPATVGNYRRRVGLVGASLVGRHVIRLLAPYDLIVAVYDPYLSAQEAVELGVEKVDDLDELCASVDILSVHAPDVEATRGMIGAAQLAALRDGATFLNTARPALVDSTALEAELVRGRIAGILDVAEPDPLPAGHPLVALPNVFVTPHVAGAMGNELHRLAELAIVEVERYAAGEPPLHPVHQEDLDRIACSAIVPGLCSVTMRHLVVEEVAKIAAECDLGAIEWGGDVHVPPGDSAAASRARTATRAAGLDCASYGSYLLADHDREPDTVNRTLDTAVELGAPNVRIWTPFGIEPGAAETAEIVDALAFVAGAAEERELTIGLEFHAGTLTATAESAADLVDRVGAPNLMTYWQPAYWLPDRAPADDALELKELGPRVSHLHVYEWRGAEDRRPLSEGRTRWHAVLGAVRDAPAPARPAPRVAFLEFVADDDPVALLRDARTLHELLAEGT